MRGAENLILYRFEAGYVKASRYLAKHEIKELEELYGKCEGYCISADMVIEFAVCRLFEEAVERWLAQGKQTLRQKEQTTQEFCVAKGNYSRPHREVFND